MALTKATEKSISDNLSISGIASASNFKTGTTNVHNVGVELAGINVLGANTPIGTGATIYNDGGARFSGIVSATSFVGSGANLTGVASTDNIKTSTTANFTGGIQVGGATTLTGALLVSGNLGVGGVLTYEDVANVDSVGIITARQGVRVNVDGSTSANYISVGAGSDLKIYHDGTANHIVSTNGQINIQTNSSENSIQCIPDGQVKLYYDNALQVSTSSSGLSFADSKKANFGADSDLSIYHDGSNSYIDDSGTGNLLVRGNNIELHKHTGETYAKFIANGAVELYYDNSKTAWTHGSGFNIKGGNTSDNTELIITGNEGQAASILMSADDGDDNADHWRIYSNADNSFTLNSYASGSYQSILKGTSDRSIELNYQGTKKAETFDSGFKISGGGELYIDGNATSGHCQIIMTRSDMSYAINNETFLRFYKQSGNSGNPNSLMAEFTNSGHFRPGADNTFDLGDSGRRWRNLYTTDLQLSNKGSQNDVDGTWGNYTIQEGESDLFLINNRNGKKYKFNLTEVS